MPIFVIPGFKSEYKKKKREQMKKNLEHLPNWFCDKKTTYFSKHESEEIYKGKKSLDLLHKHLKLQNIKNHKY